MVVTISSASLILFIGILSTAAFFEFSDFVIGYDSLVSVSPGAKEEIREERVMPVTIGMGAGLGFYEGFLGPGTGSMLLAGYVKGAGFGMDRAAATGRILNFGGNVGSFAIFALAASVDYEVALPFAIANMIGGYLAPRYVLKYGYTMLRPMFLIVSAVLIITQIISFIY